MAHSLAQNGPRAGDIILKRTNDVPSRYTLSTSGEPAQILCATRDEAIARAERFAQSHHVDVWRTDDDCSVTRIIECRVVAAAGSA